MKSCFTKVIFPIFIFFSIPALADLTTTQPQTVSLVVFPIGYDFGPMESEIPTINEQLVKKLNDAKLKISVINFDPNTQQDMHALFSAASTTNPQLHKLKEKMLTKLQPVTDFYVIPEVVARSADVNERTVAWDGVKGYLKSRGGGSHGDWKGKRTVFSLCLHIYDKTGHVKSQSCGGVSDPYILSSKPNEPDNVRKEHLFESEADKKLMQDGIDVAVAPLVKLTNL